MHPVIKGAVFCPKLERSIQVPHVGDVVHDKVDRYIGGCCSAARFGSRRAGKVHGRDRKP
jgi:hypothetical protein